MNLSSDLDPTSVRRQFERRGPRLRDADYLLREVERRMIERLDVVRLEPETIVDVGCGMGRGLLALKQRYAQAEAFGVDLAESVVGAARELNRPPRRGFLARIARRDAPVGYWIAADAAALPFADASAALLWSNLMLHWAADPRAVLREWHRIVRPDGLLMFSVFGVDTLREVSALGASLMRFHDMHDVGDWLVEAGFAEPVMDMERIEVSFPTADKLVSELRALGGNARADRVRGLSGRRARSDWLERLAATAGEDGRIRVGFEIVYGHAWRVERKPRGEYEPVRFMPRGRR